MFARRLIPVAALAAALLSPPARRSPSCHSSRLIDSPLRARTPSSRRDRGRQRGTVVGRRCRVNGRRPADSIVAAALADSNGARTPARVRDLRRATTGGSTCAAYRARRLPVDRRAAGDRFGSAAAAPADVNGDGSRPRVGAPSRPERAGERPAPPTSSTALRERERRQPHRSARALPHRRRAAGDLTHAVAGRQRPERPTAAPSRHGSPPRSPDDGAPQRPAASTCHEPRAHRPESSYASVPTPRS